ncbi:MAG: hypothetical protein AUI15_25930 [Actinobacteria bacterium 13_2_20CM_2_66_6]|nr:MAG: hypothetical protein AUI15_25930 [Actinobacteria bacterium 13_2_20CM_2_66_6]
MFFGRPRKRALRIYFATDIHGSDRCFRKFLAAAESYEADALVLGGDIAGKGLVPIRSHNGTLSAKVRGEAVTVPRDEEGRLRAEINRLGFYSLITDDADIERLESEPAHLERAFERAIIEQIEGWCKLAEERLAPRVRCIITPGNDDPKAIDPVLKAGPRIESPEAEICELGPVVMASCGDYGSGLDFAAELDPQLRPVIRGGRPSIVPVGSKAVRDVVKRYQPVVGLHGHIHESKGAQKIGSTMCLNPGSDYSADVLRGAIVDFAEDGSYIDFLFTTG